jgi:hypothetical protein
MLRMYAGSGYGECGGGDAIEEMLVLRYASRDRGRVGGGIGHTE